MNITVKLAWPKEPRKAKLSAQKWWIFYFESLVLLHLVYTLYHVKFYLISFMFCPFPVHCYQLTYFDRFSGWDFVMTSFNRLSGWDLVMTSPLFHVCHRMFAPFDSTLQILNNEPISSLPWQKVNECFSDRLQIFKHFWISTWPALQIFVIFLCQYLYKNSFWQIF